MQAWRSWNADFKTSQEVNPGRCPHCAALKRIDARHRGRSLDRFRSAKQSDKKVLRLAITVRLSSLPERTKISNAHLPACVIFWSSVGYSEDNEPNSSIIYFTKIWLPEMHVVDPAKKSQALTPITGSAIPPARIISSMKKCHVHNVNPKVQM